MKKKASDWRKFTVEFRKVSRVWRERKWREEKSFLFLLVRVWDDENDDANINSSTLKVFKAEAPCRIFGNFFSYYFLFIYLFYQFFGICLFPIRVPASFILIYYSRGTTKKYLWQIIHYFALSCGWVR